jgi:hypothetical protein
VGVGLLSLWARQLGGALSALRRAGLTLAGPLALDTVHVDDDDNILLGSFSARGFFTPIVQVKARATSPTPFTQAPPWRRQGPRRYRPGHVSCYFV